MTVKRTYDANLIAPAIKFYLDSEDKVDPIEWVSNADNIVLINEHGDMALFEKGIKHIYSGHYYFKSRGRKAIDAGKEFLDTLFNTCYNIPVLMGLSPLKNLGARWMSRQLKFESQGLINHLGIDYELFILSKERFNQ